MGSHNYNNTAHHLEQEACMTRDTRLRREGLSCALNNEPPRQLTERPPRNMSVLSDQARKEPTTPAYWPKRRKGQTCIDRFEKGFEKEQLNFESGACIRHPHHNQFGSRRPWGNLEALLLSGKRGGTSMHACMESVK